MEFGEGKFLLRGDSLERARGVEADQHALGSMGAELLRNVLPCLRQEGGG